MASPREPISHTEQANDDVDVRGDIRSFLIDLLNPIMLQDQIMNGYQIWGEGYTMQWRETVLSPPPPPTWTTSSAALSEMKISSLKLRIT